MVFVCWWPVYTAITYVSYFTNPSYHASDGLSAVELANRHCEHINHPNPFSPISSSKCDASRYLSMNRVDLEVQASRNRNQISREGRDGILEALGPLLPKLVLLVSVTLAGWIIMPIAARYVRS
jgi:hypothetical protein